MAPSIPDEYADLMKPNGDGHYLYRPQRYSQLHPGAIGYFDKHGAWNLITDISEPGRTEKDGFTGLEKDLQYETPSERMWRTLSSGSEAESSFGLSGGLSGAMSAAPVDVSAEAKNKWGKTGKAALITTSMVKNEKFKPPFSTPIQRWVKKNAKALVNSDWGADIKQYGLWAIQTTWSTQECAITMKSAHSRDISAGLDIGATGVAKMGASGSSLAKLESEGWTTYEATEGDQGLVVSFGGANYKLHTIKSIWSNVCVSNPGGRKLELTRNDSHSNRLKGRVQRMSMPNSFTTRTETKLKSSTSGLCMTRMGSRSERRRLIKRQRGNSGKKRRNGWKKSRPRLKKISTSNVILSA